MEDKIVKRVMGAYKLRSDEGIRKYGTTLERDDLNVFEWLTHLQEELMDATLYIEKLKTEEVGIPAEDVGVAYFNSMLEHTESEAKHCVHFSEESIKKASELFLTKGDQKKCIITGVELTEEDTYNKNSGCPYANFVEGFRARHKIPVRDLRKFVNELKGKL